MSAYERIKRHQYPYRPLHHKLVEAWREAERVKGGYLKKPDGYYSTPIIAGLIDSPTWNMEIIGYLPQRIEPIRLPIDFTTPRLRPRSPHHYEPSDLLQFCNGPARC
jgi:hypothetical protein